MKLYWATLPVDKSFASSEHGRTRDNAVIHERIVPHRVVPDTRGRISQVLAIAR